MGSAKYIVHEGKEILLIDFSGCKPDEIVKVTEESKKMIQTKPQNSVLTLTYVQNATFNSDVIDTLKNFTLFNKPYVKAGCVVGLSGLQKTIYTVVTRFSGRSLPLFDNLEEAKNWLIKS